MTTLILWFLACSSPPDAAPPPPPAPAAPAAPAPDGAPATATATIRARLAIQTLATTLKGSLVEQMKAAGPLGALDVCTQDAQSLTAGVGKAAGVQVGRSSLRLRNPANAPPDWVRAWLTARGERAAEGIDAAISTDSSTQTVRIVAPIPVDAPCLVCHGPTDARPADLAEAIARHYPQDAANGYALGELRGAIWAEVPIVETGMALTLDGERKWALDDSTRRAIADIRGHIATHPATLEAAQAMAASIDGSLSEMIEGCVMTGPSHDELHAFLEAFFPAVSALKNASDPAQAQASRQRLLAMVTDFDAAFE